MTAMDIDLQKSWICKNTWINHKISSACAFFELAKTKLVSSCIIYIYILCIHKLNESRVCFQVIFDGCTQQHNHSDMALDSEPGEAPVSIFIRAWNHLRPGDHRGKQNHQANCMFLGKMGMGFCVFQQTRRYGYGYGVWYVFNQIFGYPMFKETHIDIDHGWSRSFCYKPVSKCRMETVLEW